MIFGHSLVGKILVAEQIEMLPQHGGFDGVKHEVLVKVCHPATILRPNGAAFEAALAVANRILR
jgi:hypothetical protein